MQISVIGIVGAGAMGRGIAQIAAQSGRDVLLFDMSAQAVEAARTSLRDTWDKLAAKGKMSAEAGAAALARVKACAKLEDLAPAQLVIEAIVEKLEVKRDLFRQLEGIVGKDCILASNTSSLSITAIAEGSQQPGRIVGFHFFNPVPLMKVVEVIDGLRGRKEAGDALMELARDMGHKPVRAADMPGFIVNHAGRAMSTEGLKVAQESVASFNDIDDIMREQAGFRMGPFELFDLTGLDVSHPVMESVYHQFYDEPRYRPSPLAAVRTAGRVLGRKTGEGFYAYPDGKQAKPAPAAVPAMPEGLKVWVAPFHPLGHRRAAALLKDLDAHVVSSERPPADALIVVTPFGEDVASLVQEHALDAARTVALDTLFGLEKGRRRVVMCSAATVARWRDAAHALFASDGTAVTVIEDSAGFVGQRMVALIVTVAGEIAQQSIATPEDIDLAVSLGLGYPDGGPLSIGDKLGASLILEILRCMYKVTGDMRYRPGLWLRRRVQLGMSLKAGAAH